ncbi:MAG: tetratricopeptide repeat protein [Paludisphaera borealis]|uniref:tetratricopeptide repeat protein n=1 Tax=Paludisphaera borealis TaxID=1387353 RepID=UPI002848D17F|nr:tetratricopeptide repeat protein [Paludisphaera borealis]MDR3622563.1 tetratricopeptide repeat protein [Paludisphaera borealis]
MPRPGLKQVGRIIVAVGVVVLAGAEVGRAGEDPRIAEKFLQALRDHGLFDVALDYIDQLRADPEIPAEMKSVLDYHEGKTLIDEAAKSGDLVRRRELLDQASRHLEQFVKEHPDNPLSREALVEIARRIFERGHLAMLVGEESQDPAQKTAKIEEARVSFQQAHEAYNKAAEHLAAENKTIPGFLPKDDPRLAHRDKVFASMLDAMLRRAVTDYELAQTYPAASKERIDKLNEALKQFETLYNDFRTQFAGLTAQMWQAKCYEEQGKLGEAIGIYQALLRQPDPRLRTLKRNVHYFYIVALAKRKQFALAADEAVAWLQTYSQRDELRSREGLGVLFELAKNIDAQLTPETPANERQQASKKIVDALVQVVRYASPFKKESLEILKRYKPNAAVQAQELSRLTFDDAVVQGEEAIASLDFGRAIAYFKAAVKKGDMVRGIDKVNLARYNLAFAYYMNKQYYEADVLAEHLSRRYPQGGLSPKASAIGMQSLIDAYNENKERDRVADLERFIDLAKYAAKTWADREEGDDARLNLGQVYLGRGQYDEAIAEYAAVRERSPKRNEAQSRLGAAHWAKSRALDRRGDAGKAAAASEAAIAIDVLQKTLEARKSGGAAVGDVGFLSNAADLGVALTETDKPDAALALLAPIVQQQATKAGVGYARLMEAYLLAQIHAGQVEPAIVSMKAIEQAGAGTNRAQLYYKLGRLLERELDRLREKKDLKALAATQNSFRTFLKALTENKTGQTYESLQWAAESLLSLDAGAEAEVVLKRVLDEALLNPEFAKQEGSSEKLLRTRLRLATALRLQQKFDESETTLEGVLSDPVYKRYIEPQVEQGMLLDAQAEAGKANWNAVAAHWQSLAQKLGRLKPRPASYFDAWYHAAHALSKEKQTAKARQTLIGVMRLNPGLGGPEMKVKYEQFLETLK